MEGITGSGKTTLATRLMHHLKSRGREVLLTFEPGNGLAEANPMEMDSRDFSDKTKALLFAADRVEHVQREIRPALESGRIVICERFTQAFFAYQGVWTDSYDVLGQIGWFSADELEPNVTILLDVDPIIGFARKNRRTHSFDTPDMGFHNKVREIYKQNMGLCYDFDLRRNLFLSNCLIHTDNKTPEEVFDTAVGFLAQDLLEFVPLGLRTREYS